MTIAISLKVNDGLVLAADSASTLIGQEPTGQTQVINVYNNANKIFNLRKGLPIGALTWGAGSIGTSSISTLVKDLRERFSEEEQTDWYIKKDSYTIEEVASKFKKFVFDELYEPAFREWAQKPNVGFIIAGYSAGREMAEEYQIDINNGECIGPRAIRGIDESGMSWNGVPEAITRLLLGHGSALASVLESNLNVPSDQIAPAIRIIEEALAIPLIFPPMPIQDAIDLAEFMVDLTIKFSRFTPGASTVGGPIEVAAITKHEGFKWIRRKHYFTRDLNTEGPQ